MAWNRSVEQYDSGKVSETRNHKLWLLFACVALIMVVCGVSALLLLTRGDDKTDLGLHTQSTRAIPIASKSTVTITNRNETQPNLIRMRGTPKPNISSGGTNVSILVGVSTTNSFREKKQNFKSATEMILARLFSTRLGDPPPMLPEIPSRDIKQIDKILERTIDTDEQDSEKIKEMKEIADMAKQEFRKFLENGGDDREFIQYYQSKLRNYNQEYREAQRMVADMAKSGDLEMTKQFIDKINEKFDAKGIKHVKLPPKYREEKEMK